MSPDEVLAELATERRTQPHEALKAADEHRSALAGPLLEIAERCVASPNDVSEEDTNLFSYALYLFAKWQDPRIYPHVVHWLSMPEEESDGLTGDILTDHGARILAAVCGEDLEPIKALIVNRDACEFGRSAAVGALAHLVAWERVPREPIVEYFLWLSEEGLERRPGAVWDGLAAACMDIEALEVFPAFRQAYAEDLIDPDFVRPSDLDDVERVPRGRALAKFRDREPPIDDVAKATAWWGTFSTDSDREDWDHEWDDEDDEDNPYRGAFGDDEFIDAEDELAAPQEPYRAPPKVGRNEPCPCGSGKKYKKCCGK